ncbi:MAG TPA: AAA family ATPase [Thermoplasmata archaeon]|nr:AAA family ATPase [Thermoplasmata archaeon]
MSRTVVALGGPPGSGKSTAGRLVARALGLDYRSAGELFRAEARARGLDLEAFGRFAEHHPEVDTELDRAMQELARPGVLLEGRIQGALCQRRGVPVVVVLVTASPAERARRVAGRDHQELAQATRAIEAREAVERARYLKFYQIDLDREVPDLLVDSTSLPAEEVARTIVAFLRRSWGEAG